MPIRLDERVKKRPREIEQGVQRVASSRGVGERLALAFEQKRRASVSLATSISGGLSPFFCPSRLSLLLRGGPTVGRRDRADRQQLQCLHQVFETLDAGFLKSVNTLRTGPAPRWRAAAERRNLTIPGKLESRRCGGWCPTASYSPRSTCARIRQASKNVAARAAGNVAKARSNRPTNARLVTPALVIRRVPNSVHSPTDPIGNARPTECMWRSHPEKTVGATVGCHC